MLVFHLRDPTEQANNVKRKTGRNWDTSRILGAQKITTFSTKTSLSDNVVILCEVQFLSVLFRTIAYCFYRSVVLPACCQSPVSPQEEK